MTTRTRPTLTDEQIETAIAAVPAPTGHRWILDHALTHDRLRLFEEDGGCLAAAAADGEWFVESNPPSGKYAAGGREPSLHHAMRRVLLVAFALGHTKEVHVSLPKDELRGRRKIAALVRESNRMSAVDRAECLDMYRDELDAIVKEGIEPGCELARVCLDLVDNVIALIGDGCP